MSEVRVAVPVTVTMPTVLPDRTSRPARPVKAAARTAPQADSIGHIEIDLPGDVRVRVHGRVESDARSAVLTVLRSR